MSDVEAVVEALMPELVADLKRLAAIPSIAFDGFDHGPVHEAYELVVELLRGAGVEQIERLDLPDTSPIITATVPGPPGRAHGPAVRPLRRATGRRPSRAGDRPVHRPPRSDGAIYGRGAADDKSGLIAHAGALRALGGGHRSRSRSSSRVRRRGQPPGDFPADHPELFDCDALVIADMGNIRPSAGPALTTALRVATRATVSVRTLPEPKHSGVFGGVAPDALIVLIHALATLHDEHGTVAVAGLRDDEWAGTAPIDEDVSGP